jgi:ketosteroid isomerase-like protein
VAQVVSQKDLVRGVFAALDAKDSAAVTARMTDDVRMTARERRPRRGQGEVSRGDGGLRGFDHRDQARDHVHLERRRRGDCRGGCPLRAPRREKVRLPVCSVFRVRDGIVSDYRVYLDIGPVYARRGTTPLPNPGEVDAAGVSGHRT